jgi:hypothetical protein
MASMKADALRAVDARPDRVLSVRSGPLALTVDAGTIRWVRLGDRESCAGLRGVRDQSGARSAPPSPLRGRGLGDEFSVRFTAQHVRDDGIDFAWDGEISGNAAGTLTFDLDGMARARSAATGSASACSPSLPWGTRLDVETPWGTLQGRFPG